MVRKGRGAAAGGGWGCFNDRQNILRIVLSEFTASRSHCLEWSALEWVADGRILNTHVNEKERAEIEREWKREREWKSNMFLCRLV